MLAKDRTFGEFKIRKVGNSMVITVPKSLNFKEGETFTLKTDETGESLIYKKTKSTNPWENGQFEDFDFLANMQEVGNYGKSSDVGKENVEWQE